MNINELKREYLFLLYDPPSKLKLNKKLLKDLRKNIFNINEEDIYDNILIIQSYM